MIVATVPRRARPFALTAAVLVAPLLSACGSSTPALNTVTVQRSIAASILTQRHLHATVHCPSDVPRQAGLTFTCTATIDGRSYPFAATEVDDSGRVRYVGH
jgi:hypothetical protein